ncbi:MAG TPA: response regulator [Pyrinomonadaceae bacterium]|jgi:two-component system response regulator ResD|nr:response regulator [Pyrinomonadaceae bacterium]
MSAAKRRILCAESHEDVRGLIALMLEQKGYEVSTAQTVAEALRLATAERFDLYLLNDSYIDGDSFELCRRLRVLDPLTPVLLFSLDASGRYHDPALQTGAQYYVTKTSDFAALVQTIDTLLQAR